MNAFLQSGNSPPSITESEASPINVVQELRAAWLEYQDTDRRGLAFGKRLYDLRTKSSAQGNHSGKGFLPLLQEAGIPQRTAYYWIHSHEISIGERDPKPMKSEAPETATPISSVTNVPVAWSPRKPVESVTESSFTPTPAPEPAAEPVNVTSAAHRAYLDASTRSEGIASSCPNCGDEFPSKSQLKKHQHKEHPETTRGPQPSIDDYSMHPESQATVGGRSHGRNLERLRDVAASLGLDAHVSYDDGFKVTIDGETESFVSEAATREFLKKAQRPSTVPATIDIPQEPIIELRENMRVRYGGAIYRVSQKSGVPVLTLVERHEPAVVGSDEVAA